jgi:hypothetical protein
LQSLLHSAKDMTTRQCSQYAKPPFSDSLAKSDT